MMVANLFNAAARFYSDCQCMPITPYSLLCPVLQHCSAHTKDHIQVIWTSLLVWRRLGTLQLLHWTTHLTRSRLNSRQMAQDSLRCVLMRYGCGMAGQEIILPPWTAILDMYCVPNSHQMAQYLFQDLRTKPYRCGTAERANSLLHSKCCVVYLNSRQTAQGLP